MKISVLTLSVAWLFLMPIQATEGEDTFFIYIHNTTWSIKTRLAIQVGYPLKDVVEDVEKDIKFEPYEVILDGVSSNTPVTTEVIPVPKRKINHIGLNLTNYHATLSSSDTRETVIASLLFNSPVPTPLGVSFTIKGNNIRPELIDTLPLPLPKESLSLSLTDDGFPKI